MITLAKQSHLWSGLAIMLSASLFFGFGLGLCIAVVAGLAKEWYDSLGHGTPDIWDIVATLTGSLVGTLLYLLKEAL
jgi:glycopeptide antibiotics resistance protein